MWRLSEYMDCPDCSGSGFFWLISSCIMCHVSWLVSFCCITCQVFWLVSFCCIMCHILLLESLVVLYSGCPDWIVSVLLYMPVCHLFCSEICIIVSIIIWQRLVIFFRHVAYFIQSFPYKSAFQYYSSNHYSHLLKLSWYLLHFLCLDLN